MLLTTEILNRIGFRYDIEDDLWYDESKFRPKYGFRIGLSGSLFHVYYGTYGNKLGKCKTVKELGSVMFRYSKNLLWYKFVWRYKNTDSNI